MALGRAINYSGKSIKILLVYLISILNTYFQICTENQMPLKHTLMLKIRK